MTSPITSKGSVSSTALANASLQQDTSREEKISVIFSTRSLHAQIADCRNFHPCSIRAQVLSGRGLLHPEAMQSLQAFFYGTQDQLKTVQSSPTPFHGSRKELLKIITKTVHATLNRFDFNGLQPYLKIMDQLTQGNEFKEIRIDSQNENQGTTCVGMSHALIKSLEEKHGIKGLLAAQRLVDQYAFDHAAVIIECSDGFVLLEARPNPDARIFSIPFESERYYNLCSRQFGGCTFMAAKPGSKAPLTLRYKPHSDQPEIVFEYCTGIANADDLVLKHYTMKTSSKFTSIVCYNPDGSEHKYILIFPTESKIVLKSNNTSGTARTQTIPFRSIHEKDSRQKLETFLEPTSYVNLPSTFRTPKNTILQQIEAIASQESKIKELF